MNFKNILKKNRFIPRAEVAIIAGEKGGYYLKNIQNNNYLYHSGGLKGRKNPEYAGLMKLFKIDTIPWNKGKPLSEEHKWNISKSKSEIKIFI